MYQRVQVTYPVEISGPNQPSAIFRCIDQRDARVQRIHDAFAVHHPGYQPVQPIAFQLGWDEYLGL
ncbi:MAG TPA: hypothetical protein PLO57_08395 [Candidatus Cloacimonadota bacterium]|nr:hypothetical protein [Candidatus Cloacimonadota bacterium]